MEADRDGGGIGRRGRQLPVVQPMDGEMKRTGPLNGRDLSCQLPPPSAVHSKRSPSRAQTGGDQLGVMDPRTRPGRAIQRPEDKHCTSRLHHMLLAAIGFDRVEGHSGIPAVLGSAACFTVDKPIGAKPGPWPELAALGAGHQTGGYAGGEIKGEQADFFSRLRRARAVGDGPPSGDQTGW
jgi:hypothetical protein